MNEDDKPAPRENRLGRIDRKLGRIWSRFWAIVIALFGLGILSVSRGFNEETTIGSYVFIFGIGGLLLYIAWRLWQSNDGLVETLANDEPPRRRR